MNREEAVRLLVLELEGLRNESYRDLVRRIEAGSVNYVRQGSGGVRYQVEVEVGWDPQSDGNVPVMGSIDDAGWRAFAPITRSFIKSAEGAFVGE